MKIGINFPQVVEEICARSRPIRPETFREEGGGEEGKGQLTASVERLYESPHFALLS
jgi:hypothetical protein